MLFGRGGSSDGTQVLHRYTECFVCSGTYYNVILRFVRHRLNRGEMLDGFQQAKFC